MPKLKKIPIGSKWIFKHSNEKMRIKVFEIEQWSIGNKIKKSVIYGRCNSISGHICQSLEGFLENYEREF